MEAGSSPFAITTTLEKMLKNPANYPDAIPKLKELLDMASGIKKTSKGQALLNSLNSRKDPTLIFTHFLETQRFLGGIFMEKGFKVWNYHGGLSNTDKENMIANFRNEGGVFISTEVGGEGKNFQFCQHMVNFDLPWNPMKIEQRIGRIHRIGQDKPVHILNFSARGTIESYILMILDEKINMFELVIGEMDMILGNIGEEEEFENIVMEIWANARDDMEAEQRFKDLGEELLEAKREYLRQKKLDETLFGTDFSS
jgi:SNF2 family DNA or RNA helicase